MLHTYPADYKVIFVGDAAMSPYEILQAGGSVEHLNPEAGATWLKRVTGIYPHAVWLNPSPQHYWSYTPSTEIVSRLFEGRMFSLTLDGIDQAMRELVR